MIPTHRLPSSEMLLANSAGCWGQGTGEDAHRRECPALEALIPPCQAANASVLGPPSPVRRIRQQHLRSGEFSNEFGRSRGRNGRETDPETGEDKAQAVKRLPALNLIL